MKRSALAVRTFAIGLVAGLTLAGPYPASAQQSSSSSPDFSATQMEGKRLFVQRCSVCHLPPLNQPQNPGPQPFGPILSGFEEEADATRARFFIERGTVRMPGFRYTFEPEQIEAIIAYLKTLEPNE
jgi:mono/diheme cytochrome c family protein